MADTGGSPWLDLVEMSEEVESGAPPPVIQLAVGQHAQQRTLTRINIP